MKHLLFVFLLLLLILPGLQAKFRWWPEEPLKGAYTTVAHPELSWQGLLENTYQPNLEHYLEDQLGFRSDLIRLRNQLSFSLLGVARSSDLVVGQGNVLYQPNPVNAYLGKDFLGEKEILYRVQRIRKVQQELAKRNITFLVVLAPNKARYQPEDLPSSIRRSKHGLTNYEVFKRELTDNRINTLDFNMLFQQWKDTTRYPLFPNGGTHWSGYGAALAAEVLFPRIEQLRGIDLINFRRQGLPKISKDTLRFTDNDLGEPMNLVYPYQSKSLAYPHVVFDSIRIGQRRPNMLISGDSFVWALMQFSPYLETLFSPESRFWGVDETIFAYDPNYKRTGENLDQLDLRQQIESRQIILLFVTEHNLVYDKFINRLYELFQPITETDQAHIKTIEQNLIRQPGVSDTIWAQANRENRSFDEVLYGKARAIYDHAERLIEAK